MLFRSPSLQEAIVAEDLGDMRPEVYVLRDHYAFPGMNIVSFTFPDEEITHTKKYGELSIAYLGTHDNDTMKSYFYQLPLEQQGEWVYTLQKLGIDGGSIVSRMTRYLFSKKANWAILSVPDALELGAEGRINVPSVLDNKNWTWRLADFAPLEEKAPFLKEEIKKSGRAG